MSPSLLSRAPQALSSTLRCWPPTNGCFLVASASLHHVPPLSLTSQQHRHASSNRRLTKALRVPAAPSFTNTTLTHDHIIFNPPSSMPSVNHTPPKFLPPGDPRRVAFASASRNSLRTRSNIMISQTGTSLSYPDPNVPKSTKTRQGEAPTETPGHAGDVPLPPPIRLPYEKKYHLNEEDLKEMRKLRKQDPRKWTRVRLAEKFQCSQFFVSLACQSPAMKSDQDRKLMEVMGKWGRRKREAREDRKRRKTLWGRDA